MTPDEDAVVSCVLDYFEGVRRRPGAHAARTPSRSGQAVARGGTLEHVTAPEMVETTAAGSLKDDPGSRRIDVRVVDIHGDIASVVVDSNIYREYHLVRVEGSWKIANAPGSSLRGPT